MLSICIPVYNLDVKKLVFSLDEQRKKNNFPCQIILIDDASSHDFIQKNENLHNIADVYILLEKNVGRAKIRNLFLPYSTYDYLLFLDCDSTIINDYFLEKYFTQITDNQAAIICGGNDYPSQKPDKNYLLRWTYSHKKESREAREKTQKQSFMTNNFVVKKSIFEQIKFDENLTQYGHEDTLFGYELKKQNITIKHIENPVMNDVLDTNEAFLQKTELGLENLAFLVKKLNYESGFIQEVNILKFYFFIKKIYLTPLLSISYFFFTEKIKQRLTEGKVNLRLFDFYKLIYLNQMLKSLGNIKTMAVTRR